MSRSARTLYAFVVCAVAAGGGVAFAAGSSVSSPRALIASSLTAPLNAAEAQSDAAALLAKLPLPADAAPSPTEPAEGGGYLAHPWIGPPASPNAVDDHAWWIVPGPPADVRAYIDEHLATGSSAISWGAGKDNGVTTFEGPSLSQLQLTGTPGPGRMAVSVVGLPSGSTALRADAQVVWVTLRPPTETIRPGAHILRIEVHSSIRRNQPKQPPLKVLSTRRIDEIVALLNALPAAQPGVFNCLVSFGVEVELALYAKHGAPLMAAAEIEVDGCGIVHLTIKGAAQPPLQGGLELLSRMDRALGTKLDTTPPWLLRKRHP